MTINSQGKQSATSLPFSQGNYSHSWILNTIERKEGYGPIVFNGIGLGNDNSYYFDTVRHPESDTIKALVATELQAISEIVQDRPLVYIPCGISSGLRAHEAAIDSAPSTYKIDEFIGSDRHYNDVISPNQQDNLRRSVYVQKLLPDACIVPPVMREMSVRELVRNPALSGRLKYEEEAFMALWYPLIDQCRYMVLDGDWNYSRNSIWEMMRGVLIQASLHPLRPKSDIDVITINGDPVTLLARTQKLAESLKYSLGKGFEPREAANGLAQIFTIDSWLRDRDPRVRAGHDILRNRTQDELDAMDALKIELNPLINTYCAGWLRSEDLLLPYKTHHALAIDHEKRTGELHTAIDEKLLKKLRKFSDNISAHKGKIIRGDLSREQQAELDAYPAPQQRRYDSKRSIFGPEWRSYIAEDKLFDKLHLWEQAILPFVFGAMEIAMFPLHEPMATALFTDLKRGRLGFNLAKRKNVHDMAEFTAVEGRDVQSEVIKPNLAATERYRTELKKKNPNRIVVSTPNFLRVFDTIEWFRKTCPTFIAARGANETSPRMRLVLAMKFLERNIDEAIFQSGWEHSDDLVQLRLRARLIQAGIAPRPVGDPIHLKVYTDKITPKGQDTLLDDVTVLTKKIEYCASHDVKMPEQAMALIRMLELDDLLSDQRLRQEIIDLNPHRGSINWTDYDRDAFKKVRQKAEEILFDRPELWPVDRERLVIAADEKDSPGRLKAIGVENQLMQRFAAAQTSGRGHQALRKAQRPTEETHYDFAAPQL